MHRHAQHIAPLRFTTQSSAATFAAQGAMMVQVPADKNPGDTFTFSVLAPPVQQQPVVVAVQPVQVLVQPVVALAPVPNRPQYFARVSTLATCIHCNHTGPTVGTALYNPLLALY